MDFPFYQPENETVIVCKHILEDKADITFVSRDEDDGGWQFLCNLEIHNTEDARVVSLKEVYTIDHTIAALRNMPPSAAAIRIDKNSMWQKVT